MKCIRMTQMKPLVYYVILYFRVIPPYKLLILDINSDPLYIWMYVFGVICFFTIPYSVQIHPDSSGSPTLIMMSQDDPDIEEIDSPTIPGVISREKFLMGHQFTERSSPDPLSEYLEVVTSTFTSNIDGGDKMHKNISLGRNLRFTKACQKKTRLSFHEECSLHYSDCQVFDDMYTGINKWFYANAKERNLPKLRF